MARNESDASDRMSIWAATSIGVGAMIGAGIFALVGIAIQIAGPLAYVSFALAGITALLTAYSVSRLAASYPSQGGPVEFLNRGYSTGVLAGALNLLMWLGYLIVTSLYARTFGEYGAALVGLSEGGVWPRVFGSLAVIAFVLLNFAGSAAVGRAELLIVAVKVAVLVAFGVLGATTMDTSRFALTPAHVDLGGLVLAGGVVFMSYEGFGLVTNTAEDLDNPRRDLPIALFASIVIVLVIYVLICIVVTGNLSVDEVIAAKDYALAEAARPVLGALGFTIMGIAALFSTASAINATLYGPIRMLEETAHAGQVSAFFTRPLFGHSSGTALVVTGAIVLLASNLLALEDIAETGSLIFLLAYTAVNVANLRLRGRTGSRTWLVVAGIAATSLSFLALLYYQIRDGAPSAWLLFAFVAACFVYEVWFQRRK